MGVSPRTIFPGNFGGAKKRETPCGFYPELTVEPSLENDLVCVGDDRGYRGGSGEEGRGCLPSPGCVKPCHVWYTGDSSPPFPSLNSVSVAAAWCTNAGANNPSFWGLHLRP